MSAQEDWNIFNSVAKKAISQPNLKGQALVDTFLRIEDQISYAINVIVETTTYVEDNLGYLLAEIALGMIKYRKVYRGNQDKERVKIGLDQDVNRSNLRILSRGFDLYKLSKASRDEAVPLVKRVLSTLDLNYSVYENIVRAFCKETRDYCSLCNRQLEARLALETWPDLTEQESQLLNNRVSDLQDEIDLIEQSVGAVRTRCLYGAVRIVDACMNSISDLQSSVQRSYQKMIPKPARNKSINETEGLDLFQSGSIGLRRAISLFDVHGKSGFPSFAQYWIKQKIMSSAKLKSPIIRVPWSTWEAYQKIRRQELKFEASPTMRHVYTDEDVARAIGKSLKSVQKAKERVANIKMVSLDNRVRNEDGYESDLTVGSSIIDQNLEDSQELEDRREEIRELLSFLTDKERTMVCLRFGFTEEVDNSNIDPTEVAREVLRQAACKAKTYQHFTTAPRKAGSL
jgi:RNA polymerase sigma factor (sigma-70 family)